MATLAYGARTDPPTPCAALPPTNRGARMLNLAVMLEDSARQVPDREAVVLGDARMSYADVDAAANQVANLLVERGIGAGDKVAISCPNLPYFPVIYYGILKVGA